MSFGIIVGLGVPDVLLTVLPMSAAAQPPLQILLECPVCLECYGGAVTFSKARIEECRAFGLCV